MLLYVNYNIVFQEIPGEVTLAVNLSNCPNECDGCHSPYLQQNVGKIFDKHVLNYLLDKYGDSITCVCFMGGDSDPEEVERLSTFVHNKSSGTIKTGWYSGRSKIYRTILIENFNFIKLGPYIKKLGGLSSHMTNQRFYKIEKGKMINQTFLFQ